MHKEKSFTLRSRINSFGFAANGLIVLIKQEPNVKIHLAATIIVIITGFIKSLSAFEWVAIIMAIAAVWITEAINTTVEMVCDLYCNKEYNKKVKIIKDIAAGSVLIASIASIIIALIIFIK